MYEALPSYLSSFSFVEKDNYLIVHTVIFSILAT